MFRKKYIASPLNYWEEKSYMMVIPSKEDDDLLKNAITRLSKSKEIKLLSNTFNVETHTIELTIEYEDDKYDIGIFTGGVSIPDYYLRGIQFTEDEKTAILNASTALTIYMDFTKDVKLCYQLELKLAVLMVPDFAGIMDESAERMLARSWVLLSANSRTLPSSKDLFSVQVILGKNEKVWIHTHGLCRCGLSELEILESDTTNEESHYNILNTYAMYLIDKKEPYDPHMTGAYIGRLMNGYPLVITSIPWTDGLNEYKKLTLGGEHDRKRGHNTKTDIIFIFKSEEDEKNGVLSKLSDYDEFLKDNPLFFFSDEETDRMKDVARERFSYVEKAFANPENHILIKIGLPLEEEGKYEHIWFELIEINKGKFKGRLTQEPYYIEGIHKDYENWYTKEDVTDWIIYTPEYSVTPDTAYLLER